jgi:hypothetical protein
LFRFPLEFNNGIFESTCSESNDWGLTNEELVLDNASWLESGWHQTKVGTSIDQGSICEELLWCSPETVWELVLEMPHLMSTTCRIRLSHICWSSDNDLNLSTASFNDALCSVQNQMNSLLRGNSSDKCKEWYRVIKILVVEVFHLDLLLG